MKKLMNKLSGSGKFESDALRDEKSYEDEHFGTTHYRKPTSLPADMKDTSEDIKIKKSMKKALSPRSSSNDIEESDFSRKKTSSGGVKADKEKLNESNDKMKKSSSLRKKSVEVKNPDSIRSPSLKNIFVSQYEQGLEEEGSDDDSMEDEVPRSRGSSMNDDDFYTTTPIRVPSSPARMSPSPRATTPPALQPRVMSPQTTPASPSFSLVHIASSPLVPSPNARVPSIPRSASSPNPNAQVAHPQVVVADDFDLRFGSGRQRAESVTEDDYGTALNGSGKEYNKIRVDSTADVDMDEDISNEKGKSGLFSSFGSNKPRKLKA